MSTLETHTNMFRPWYLKRILQRWIEYRRLAAPSAPDGDRTDRVSRPPVPPTQPAEAVGEYEPKPGMRGRNVEWVPCSPVVLEKMLDMAKVTPDDFIIDPGSGDGRIVIRVAKRGTRALGIESNPRLAALSRRAAIQEGVGDRAFFVVGDFYEMDFSGATVLTLFLRRDINLKLRPKILEMAPGTRIVSNIFDMGDWEADEVAKIEDGDYYFRNHTARLWIVPAKVEGIWKLPQGELEIIQKFQMITGSLRTGGQIVSVKGKITADHIDFTADKQQLTGRVIENRLILEENGSRETRRIAKLNV